jgi:carbon monoxide dehydrogenase subunit G
MVRRQQQFTVRRPVETVYRFLSDPARVGSCLAFVAGTENGRGQLRWRMKAPMSGITGTPEFILDFHARPPDEVCWRGQGTHLETQGHLILSTESEDTTVVDFTLEMTALGAMALVIEPMAKVQIEGQMDYFASQVREALETGERK